MSSRTQLVTDFHEKFGHPVGGPLTFAQLQFRMRIMREEFTEMEEALGECLYYQVREGQIPREKLEHFLKEITDLLYTVEGTAVTFALPIDEAFAETHRSNMTKTPGGSDTKKAVNGLDWSPADYSHLHLGV